MERQDRWSIVFGALLLCVAGSLRWWEEDSSEPFQAPQAVPSAMMHTASARSWTVEEAQAWCKKENGGVPPPVLFDRERQGSRGAAFYAAMKRIQRTAQSSRYTHESGSAQVVEEIGKYDVDAASLIDYAFCTSMVDVLAEIRIPQKGQHPHIEQLYEWIVHDATFTIRRVRDVRDIRAGDIIVVVYPQAACAKASGHAMVVGSELTPYGAQVAVHDPLYERYNVPIWDASQTSNHSSDTRRAGAIGGGIVSFTATDMFEPSSFHWTIASRRPSPQSCGYTRGIAIARFEN